MADELSPEHEQYFRTVFEEFDKNGDNVMAKEVKVIEFSSLDC